jgi:hypothetical protein
MRAMNAFRRFLLRGGIASRMAFLAAFAVLLARALLPGAVMLDSVSTTEGGISLVMCSGHGPMFAPAPNAMANTSNATADLDMSHMAAMMQDDMGMSHMSGSQPHNSMAGDDGLCPFSAALVVGCVAVALAVILFALTRATQSWSAMSARPLARLSPYFRPLSRAPPRFS